MEKIAEAIRNSIDDARNSVSGLSRMFSESVQPLRVEESGEVFTGFANNVSNLQTYIEYVNELQAAIQLLEKLDMPADPIMSGNKGKSLFGEMQSALESKDWVLLSDLIEYELLPLLDDEGKWLVRLDDKIRNISM